MINRFKKAFRDTFIVQLYKKIKEEIKFKKRQYRNIPAGFLFYGNALMEQGNFEITETNLFSELFKEADIFIDIGANIGYFTCLACSSGLKVFAFEPSLKNLPYLYENIRQNQWQKQVEVFPIGLSDKPDLLEIYGEGTGASLISGWAGASTASFQIIPVNSLNSVVGGRLGLNRVVVKIDIEGAEYQALCGADKILDLNPKPIWLVEITFEEHRHGSRNPKFKETFELFWSRGYKAYSVGKPALEVSKEMVEDFLTGRSPYKLEANYLFADSSFPFSKFLK